MMLRSSRMSRPFTSFSFRKLFSTTKWDNMKKPSPASRRFSSICWIRPLNKLKMCKLFGSSSLLRISSSLLRRQSSIDGKWLMKPQKKRNGLLSLWWREASYHSSWVGRSRGGKQLTMMKPKNSKLGRWDLSKKTQLFGWAQPSPRTNLGLLWWIGLCKNSTIEEKKISSTKSIRAKIMNCCMIRVGWRRNLLMMSQSFFCCKRRQGILRKHSGKSSIWGTK